MPEPGAAEPRWAGTRVLLTGATGFIGSRLAGKLAEAGARVHAAARRPSALPGVVSHAGDLAEAPFASRLLRAAQPEIVFHLASRVTGSQALAEVLPTLHANLTTTVNLLVAAVETGGPRFVTAGSLVETAGGARDAPASPYAAAKWAAGHYARMFHALHDLPATVARIFMVYGPGQRDPTKLVPYTILTALRGAAPRCASGTRLVDWVYVDDVVDGLLALAAARHTAGDTVDLGSGTLTSVRDVVDGIVRSCGSAAPVFGARPDPLGEPVVAADADRTERLIGWRARTSLHDGIAATIDWYRRSGPGTAPATVGTDHAPPDAEEVGE